MTSPRIRRCIRGDRGKCTSLNSKLFLRSVSYVNVPTDFRLNPSGETTKSPPSPRSKSHPILSSPPEYWQCLLLCCVSHDAEFIIRLPT